MEPEAGRNNLSTHLSFLRRALRVAGGTGDSVLQADWQSVRLNSALVTTDVAEFERCLKPKPAETPTEQRQRLERAVAMYRGEFLPGCYEDWAVQAQSRLRRQFLEALLVLSRLLAAQGDLTGSLKVARRVVQEDPANEDAVLLTMHHLGCLGRTPEALTLYREFTLFLEADLGVSPSAAAEALARELRQNPPPVVREIPSVVSPSVASSFPSVSSQGTPSEATIEQTAEKQMTERISSQVSFPPVVPIPWTRFFGREEELAALKTLLSPAPDSPRLVTLLGPGGVGKTRLAIETAGQMTQAYAGHLWVVTLAELPSAALIPFALARTLNIPMASAESVEGFVDKLSGSPALLVLDNFEHLLHDAGTTKGDQPTQPAAIAFLRGLLERLPDLRCLVTSRQPLQIGGERTLTLSPLALPTETASLEEMRRSGSIALYIDRAQSVKADFVLTEQNAATVAAICRTLEGVPLAIEMAAAWAKMMPPARVLERLDRQLGVLVSRRRDLPSRHQSMRAVIEWSYALLSPEQQQFFVRASVFCGGWQLEAAEAICSPDAWSLTETLLDQSLLVVEEKRYGAEEVVRFRMLEPLREFGLEKLAEKAEEQETRKAHADYFLTFARTQETAYRERQEAAGLDRLEADYDNLRSALTWYTAHDSASGLALLNALHAYWTLRGNNQEIREYYAALLPVEQDTLVSEDRANALYGASNSAWRQGDYASAIHFAERNLHVSQVLGYTAGIAKACKTLAHSHWYRGEYNVAEPYYERCLQLHTELNDLRSVTVDLNNLGLVAVERGNLARARTLYMECLELRTKMGNRQGIGAVLINLGELEMREKNLVQARVHLNQSLAIAREFGDKMTISYVCHALGRLAVEESREQEAAAYYRESLTLRNQIQEQWGLALLTLDIARLAVRQEETSQAAEIFGIGAAILQRLGSPLPPTGAGELEVDLAALRSTLGESAFLTAHERGCFLAPAQRTPLLFRFLDSV